MVFSFRHDPWADCFQICGEKAYRGNPSIATLK
jgi:hypothetical protein